MVRSGRWYKIAKFPSIIHDYDHNCHHYYVKIYIILTTYQALYI